MYSLVHNLRLDGDNQYRINTFRKMMLSNVKKNCINYKNFDLKNHSQYNPPHDIKYKVEELWVILQGPM